MDRPAAKPTHGLMSLLEQERLTPNPSFAFCDPAIDWNTRSTGAFAAIAFIAVVT